VLTVASSSRSVLASVLNSPGRRRLTVSILGILAIGILPAFSAPSNNHLVTVPVASGPWLDRFNSWRANAGVPAVSEDGNFSAGDLLHATYMVQTGDVAHSENPAFPQYTAAGNTAAQNSNIFVSSSTGTSDSQAIDWWMGAPFHAMAMMDPRLTTTGFGSYRNAAYTWAMGAAVNVGQGMGAAGHYPVFFPGNGSTEPLTSFSGNEFPNPQQACPGYTGLPLFVEVGANVNTAAGPATLLANGATVASPCVIDSTNATLASYLKWRGGAIVFPPQPLQNGVNYTVALTVNGVPYTWSFTVGPLSTLVPPPPSVWQSLGGGLASSPSASSWSPTRVDAFIQGTDNQLYHIFWDGTRWSAWEALGGVLNASPGVVSWGPNRIDVFVRGTDNGMWHKWRDGSGSWSGWESHGGVLTSSPVVASWSAGRLDIFVRGADSALWHKSWDGSRWSGWDGLGGVLTADPSAVSWGPNRIDLFVRGSDDGMWHKAWDGGTWSGWDGRGGTLTSAPSATSCTSGHLDVFVRGTDNALWHQGFNGSSWSGWSSAGGNWTSGPSAVCRRGTSVIDLFVRGTDNALWTEPVPGS